MPCEVSLSQADILEYLSSNYFGMFEIISRGYTTSVYVNGVEQCSVSDSVLCSQSKGKLKIGINTIKIKVVKLKDSPPYKPVIVKLFIIDKNKKYKKGFTVDWGNNEEYENIYTFAPDDLYKGTTKEEFIIENK